MNHASLRRAPTTPDTAPAERSHFEHRRIAIDMIATLRARMIRCALFGTYILRPHPVTPETDAVKAQWRAHFEEQFKGIQRSYGLLDGHDTDGTVPQDICTWINEGAAAMPDQVKVLRRMMTLTEAMRTALDGSDQDLDSAMQAHFAFGRGQFYGAVTQICDALWAQLDLQRDRDMDRAREHGEAIADILERLERIGKHVRLVSLNASVEAARVGDAGKGLGVIATEFKTLAEEIQHLAATARDNINGMTAHSG